MDAAVDSGFSQLIWDWGFGIQKEHLAKKKTKA